MLETMPEKLSHISHIECNIQHFHWIAFVLKYIENWCKWSICCISGHVNCPGINKFNAGNCAGNKYAIRHLVCNYWNFNWTPFIFKYIENKCKLTFYYIYGAANCTSMKEINLVPGILLSGILVSGILASSIFGIRHWFEPYSKTLNLNHFSSTHIPFVYDLKRRGFIY